MQRLLILSITFAISLALQLKDCNFTNYDFFSHYSLGKMDELNNTFAMLNTQVGPLPDISFKPSALDTYTLSEIKAEFYYRDSRQTAEVIDKNMIYIKGGNALTTIGFNWKKNNLEGNGTALCETDSISFGKGVKQIEGFVVYYLADHQKISYDFIGCNILRVNPVLQPPDIQIFQSLFNQNQGKNVKCQLLVEINKYYVNDLNSSMHDDRQPLNTTFIYSWIDPVPGKKNITINYTILPTGYNLNKEGLSYTFVSEITDDNDWKCGSGIPSTELDVKIYGGIQEFLSFSIFENTIRFGIDNNVFDTNLTRNNWESRMFQFYAGDLYEIIPKVSQTFYAKEEVTGVCSASNASFKLERTTNTLFNVQMTFDCELSIARQKVSNFQLTTIFTIETILQFDHLNFKVLSFTRKAKFFDYGDYLVKNVELAELYVTHSLNRVKQSNIFGSGWKIYTRDYPKILYFDGYAVVYDDSHIA